MGQPGRGCADPARRLRGAQRLLEIRGSPAAPAGTSLESRPAVPSDAAAARITFQGAAETVTGSRYLVEHGGARLLVDCGLFQGPKNLRQRNWAAPGFDPASIDAVPLTPAHIDHSGYLPRLCKAGFRGPVYCTEGTRDLVRILLPDAGYLQE